MAPTDAAATAIALAAALDGLSGTDPQAVVDRIAWRTDRLEAKGRGVAHCDIEKWSSEVSPDLVAIVLGAVHRSQGRRAVRLYYRTTTGRPQPSARGLQLPRARAQKTPVSLWDTWTLRMMPRTSCGNLRWSADQQALAVSPLQVGAWINLPQALNLLGNSIPVKTLSRTLGTLHTRDRRRNLERRHPADGRPRSRRLPDQLRATSQSVRGAGRIHRPRTLGRNPWEVGAPAPSAIARAPCQPRVMP